MMNYSYALKKIGSICQQTTAYNANNNLQTTGYKSHKSVSFNPNEVSKTIEISAIMLENVASARIY